MSKTAQQILLKKALILYKTDLKPNPVIIPSIFFTSASKESSLQSKIGLKWID